MQCNNDDSFQCSASGPECSSNGQGCLRGKTSDWYITSETETDLRWAGPKDWSPPCPPVERKNGAEQVNLCSIMAALGRTRLPWERGTLPHTRGIFQKTELWFCRLFKSRSVGRQLKPPKSLFQPTVV